MKFVVVMRFSFMAALFVLYSVVSAAHLYIVWGWSKLTGASRSVKRRRVGHLHVWWGNRYFHLISWCMGFKGSFKISESVRKLDPDQPFIVVSNHQSLLDNLALPVLLRKIGIRDVRWVLKKGIRHRALHIGHSMIAMECAFVGRNGHAQDKFKVKRCAWAAKEDGASMVIYPEGHRFVHSRIKRNYRNVLCPRTKGFQIILDELPDYPVLSVTLNWVGKSYDGTSFWNTAFVAERLEMECEVYLPEEARRDGWLTEEWRRKDDRLSGEMETSETVIEEARNA